MPKRSSIYLDYAATTPVAPEVLRSMQPYWREDFANASSLHALGQRSREALKQSRKTIARLFNCSADEIIFTSGGTESINLALKGHVATQKKKKQHIISTNIEHAATLATLNWLKKQGHSITLAPCDNKGLIRAKNLVSTIRKETTLISIIFVQNEIGTIQPVAEIGRLLININRERVRKGLPEIVLHADACQAPAWMNLNLPTLHADLLSLDASKMYGPKGVGLLFKRKGIELQPLIHGGGQEKELRSGTEPIPLIVGLAASLSYVSKMRPRYASRITKLRDYMFKQLKTGIPNCIVIGDIQKRIANNVNISLPDREGDDIVFRLDRMGIAASTGSACSTADMEPSHVIAALKLPKKYRDGSLRFSLGYATTKKEIDFTVDTLKKIVGQ